MNFFEKEYEYGSQVWKAPGAGGPRSRVLEPGRHDRKVLEQGKMPVTLPEKWKAACDEDCMSTWK